MPEGGDFLYIIEEFHYQKNCEQLVNNMQSLLSSNKLKENFDVNETYGVPITNLYKCTGYKSVSKYLNETKSKLEVKSSVIKNYNLVFDKEKNLFTVSS